MRNKLIKKNYFLIIIIYFFIFNINNSFAFQITQVDNTLTNSGNASSNQWVEIFNDSDFEKDISNYRFLDSGAPTTGHSISTTSLANNFIIPPRSYFILAKDEKKDKFKNLNCKVFQSDLKIKANDNVSFKNKEINDIATFQVNSVNSTSTNRCHLNQINQNTNNSQSSISTSTTSSTSTTQTSTSTSTSVNTNNLSSNIIYVYLPTNNQRKYGDINILLPESIEVPSLADVSYTVKITDTKKNVLDIKDISWSFGDGGERYGKDVFYHYHYPGEYIVIAEVDGFAEKGQAKMKVKVYNADIKINKVGNGENENFIELKNNTNYDVYLSNFILKIDDKEYKFPKNFVIAKNNIVKVSGKAMGFILPAKNISLLYPNRIVLDNYIQNINTEIKKDILLNNKNLNSTNTLSILSSSTNNSENDFVFNLYNPNYYKNNIFQSQEILENTDNKNIDNKKTESQEDFKNKNNNKNNNEIKYLKNNFNSNINKYSTATIKNQDKNIKNIEVNKIENKDTDVFDYFKNLFNRILN